MTTCQCGQSLTICTRCYHSIGVKIIVLTKEDVLYEGVISISLSCLITGHNGDSVRALKNKR